MFKIIPTNETLGHKQDQPGLRGHSHDPEYDLMKQFVVEVKNYGWLWVASFHTEYEAIDYLLLEVDYDKTARIWDQFNNIVTWGS